MANSKACNMSLGQNLRCIHTMELDGAVEWGWVWWHFTILSCYYTTLLLISFGWDRHSIHGVSGACRFSFEKRVLH